MRKERNKKKKQHHKKKRKKINYHRKHVAKSLEPSGETIVPTIRASFKNPLHRFVVFCCLFFFYRDSRGHGEVSYYLTWRASDRGKIVSLCLFSLPNESTSSSLCVLSVYIFKKRNSTGIEPSISRKRAVVFVRR
jgi:hypothetical protein